MAHKVNRRCLSRGQGDVRNEASGIGVAGVVWAGRASFTVRTSSFVMRWWHAKEIEKNLRSEWDAEVQTFGPGDDDGKQVRILNRILTWGPNSINWA